MLLYRICKTKHLKKPIAEGCLHTEGRWNNKGTLIGYTSENESTAMLEILVNLQELSILKMHYSLITLELDDALIKMDFDVEKTFKNWRNAVETRQFSRQWVNAEKYENYAAIVVPSVVVPHSKNCIINAQFNDLNQYLTEKAVEPLTWDSRLIKN